MAGAIVSVTVKQKKIILKNDALRKRACHVIESLPGDDVFEVIIRPHKKDRSLQQNAYYWKIVTIIANDLGQTKDELHFEMKRKFLTRIFCRDDEGYAEMAQAIRVAQSDVLARKVVDLTSTTQASVAQMSEYIDDVIHFASSMGIRLPAKEYDA